MTDFVEATHRLITDPGRGYSVEEVEEIKQGILRLGGVEAFRAVVRDEIADAYDLPTALRDAWDTIKEGEA